MFCMFFLAAFVVTTGCSRRGSSVSPKFPHSQPSMAEIGPPSEEFDSEPMLGEGAMEGFGEGELPIMQTELARELIFEEAGRELQTVYFDYDSAALKPAAKANLERGAEWLKRTPKVNVQVEGHCDERGTNEYNLALGERRALAARRYLVSLGIAQDRIFTISYGEERPAVEGHDESAWKFNRRAEFKVSF
jgi:peptidoglycan-associated lipoprotein